MSRDYFTRYHKDAQKRDLIRRGLLPGERGSDREERADLWNEIDRDVTSWVRADKPTILYRQCGQHNDIHLVRWLSQPWYARLFWTVVR